MEEEELNIYIWKKGYFMIYKIFYYLVILILTNPTPNIYS